MKPFARHDHVKINKTTVDVPTLTLAGTLNKQRKPVKQIDVWNIQIKYFGVEVGGKMKSCRESQKNLSGPS